MKIDTKFLITIIITINYSCSTSKMNLDFSNEIISKENTIHIKGTRGKGLVGSTRNLEFDKYYNGKLKEGWTKTSDIVDKFPYGFFSKETFERSLYKNLGLDINDITSKTSDKFQFTISDTSNTWVAFCSQIYEGKSTNYDILDKVNYSKGKSQKSDFNVQFISITDKLQPNWKLELKFDRETPDGAFQTFLNVGMAIETGQISNGIETITIEPIFLRGKEIENNKYADIIKIVGGYKFIYGNKPIAIVDKYKQTISLFELNNPFNTIITASATSILLRGR